MRAGHPHMWTKVHPNRLTPREFRPKKLEIPLSPMVNRKTLERSMWWKFGNCTLAHFPGKKIPKFWRISSISRVTGISPVGKKLCLCARVPPMILPRGSPERRTVPIFGQKTEISIAPNGEPQNTGTESVLRLTPQHRSVRRPAKLGLRYWFPRNTVCQYVAHTYSVIQNTKHTCWKYNRQLRHPCRTGWNRS